MAYSVAFILVVFLYISHVKADINLGKNDFAGIFPTVFTPYYDNGTINVEIISCYAKFLADSGIRGVIVCGINGEGPMITREERMLLADAWMAAGKQYNLQVVLQIAALPFPDALKLAKYAEEKGVNGILALPEQYYRPIKVGELVYYMKLLADQAPNTPIFYYDYPGLTNVYINMVDFFINATCIIPTFSGLKTDFTTALQVIANTQLQSYQRLFVRTDVELASSFLMGLNEVISGLCNLFPKLCIAIQTAVKSGNITEARELQFKMDRGVAAVAYITEDQDDGEFIGLSKVGMEIMTGIKVGELRVPLKRISCETRKTMAQNLMSAGFNTTQKNINCYN